MNILIMAWRDIKNPQAGGSEIYFHELAKRWVAWGNYVTLLTSEFEGSKKEETIDGVRIIRSGKKFGVYIKLPSEYLKKMKNENFDAIIDVENGIPFFSPIYVKRNMMNKIFLHIHHIHRDVWFKEMNFPMNLVGWIIETKIMPLIYKKNMIITLSKSSADEIMKEGFSKNYPKIISPGITFYRYKKVRKSKKPMLLFLNRIKKYKGLETLLNAINLLKKLKKDSFDVIIAGTGDDLGRMKKYADERDLQCVRFLGRISEKEKVELMQRAWIFINPSFKEGWGIVNIEANYLGTPVIGANVGGTRDYVINGKTGLLFEYDNAKELAEKIDALFRDKPLRERMSKNGERWAKKFDWDKQAREYLKIIKRN